MSDDDLTNLLAVQDLDTTISQLTHRRDALAESSGLRAVEAELVALDARRVDADARKAVLLAAQKELEEQIGGISARRDSLEKRMLASTSHSARDLQAMNDEVRHLDDRRAELEEAELVVMVDQDPVDLELAEIDAARVALSERAAALRVDVAAGSADIDSELEVATAQRATEAARIPTALGERYEKLRAHLRGTGAARLVKNRCEGCHLELASSEVEHIRALPAGEVATCEQCGRILVPV